MNIILENCPTVQSVPVEGGGGLLSVGMKPDDENIATRSHTNDTLPCCSWSGE